MEKMDRKYDDQGWDFLVGKDMQLLPFFWAGLGEAKG